MSRRRRRPPVCRRVTPTAGARYRSGGITALADRSSAPRRCPHRTPPAQVAEIKRLREEQRSTGPAIARQLGVPVSTVGKVLRRIGLGRLSALEPKPPMVCYQRERSGELIHIDVKNSAASRGSGIASPAIDAIGPKGAGNTC